MGHVPRKISSTCSLFLRHEGIITCKITDPKIRYSRDLEQGGLEIPCMLPFQGECELLAKVQKLLSLSMKNILLNKLSEFRFMVMLKRSNKSQRKKTSHCLKLKE